MKKQIREGVFETNSSSTHSICIAKNANYELPEKLNFTLGEFGWGEDRLDSIGEKASYLYTGLVHNGMYEEVEKLTETLKSKGVEVTLESEKSGSYYYVDHGYDLMPFLNDVLSDETKLLNYLFSPLSFVLTGNDNSDSDVDINVGYEHDSYYKGN